MYRSTSITNYYVHFIRNIQ